MNTVTATRSTRQARKPARTVRFFQYGDKAVLVINQQFSATRGQLDTYALEPIPADFGRGLLLTKEDGSSYCVNLSGPDSTCDCRGFESHGHCKHIEGLTALAAAGKL